MLGPEDTADIDKINRLVALPTLGKSVGIMVNASTYEAEKHRLLDVEFVPGFKSLDVFIKKWVGYETLTPAYDALDPLRKQWLKVIYTPETLLGLHGRHRLPSCIVYLKPFEQTEATYIAIELLDDKDFCSGKEIIERNCMQQLHKVINYAYECENKKVLLVNNTKFSQQVLLEKIIEEIPKEAREEILVRMQALGLTHSERLSINTALQDFRFTSSVENIILDYVMPSCRLYKPKS